MNKAAFPFIRLFYPTGFGRTGFIRVTNRIKLFLVLVFPFVQISARINNPADNVRM